MAIRDPIHIEVDDKQVLDALRDLSTRLGNLQPAMRDIGEYLISSTKARFVTSTGPDGTPWQRNSQTTYLKMLGQHSRGTTKQGKLNAHEVGAVMGKKPLIGETKRLSSEIAYDAQRTSVLVGSNLVYAATQQFGAKRGAFGKNKRGNDIPWGDIPARPFLGLSVDDTGHVLDIVRGYLAEFSR